MGKGGGGEPVFRRQWKQRLRCKLRKFRRRLDDCSEGRFIGGEDFAALGRKLEPTGKKDPPAKGAVCRKKIMKKPPVKLIRGGGGLGKNH